MKKKLRILVMGLMVLGMIVLGTSTVLAGVRGIDNPPGIPLYVIIEVTWDGDPSHDGSWTVYGPKWDPVVGGPILASCPSGPVGTCLEMDYEFTFHGKTVHFDEVMVEGVEATPQESHVVLRDKDGDGTYNGSLAAAHYFPWRAEPDGTWAVLYFDRIEYEISFDADGNVLNFYYLQYEHKKLP
jgi:hypothetical protein